MLDQFFAAPLAPYSERTAFQFAWRPAGARPLTAAMKETEPQRSEVQRPPMPTFELL